MPLPPSKLTTMRTFLVNNSNMNLPGVSIFCKLNLVYVVILVFESKDLN